MRRKTISRRKGNERERQAKELLEDCGFKVEKAYNRRFGRNDYFGLFDLMASREMDFRMIQVKSNGTQGELKDTSQGSAFLPWYSDVFNVEFWICYDRKGWRVQRLHRSHGWVVELDERGRSGNMGDLVRDWLN